DAAEVEDDELAGAEGLGRRAGVREGAPEAARHDGLEGHPLAPPLEVLLDDLGREVPLAHARPDEREDRGEDLVGDGLRGADPRDLLLRLRRHVLVEKAADGEEADLLEELAEALDLREREVV